MAKNNRKTKVSILIISLLVVAFFIFVVWVRSYELIIKPSPPATIGIGNTSSTPTSTATSIPTTTIATTTPVVRQPTSTTSSVTILPPESAQNIGHVVGIAGGGALSKISTSTLNMELNQMVSLGVQWVRFDIEWGDVQYGSPTGSTWNSYDTLVNALIAHHLHGLGVIVYTPGWARAQGCDNGVECPPADPTTFATFAAEIAARYKGDGLHYWEIWNEPNNYNFWAPKTNCAAYTTLLKVTYPAIKQADQNAVVITGGLAPESTDSNNTSPTDFLSCVYANSGKNYFDAVGDHPYSFPAFPSANTPGAWGQMSETTPSLRSIMIANGDANKKIWITEFGTPTDGPDPNWYVNEASETQMVLDTFQLYRTYTWAGPLFWYTIEDGSNSTSTNENFFGLVRYDGSTKPAYTTLKNIIAAGL